MSSQVFKGIKKNEVKPGNCVSYQLKTQSSCFTTALRLQIYLMFLEINLKRRKEVKRK